MAKKKVILKCRFGKYLPDGEVRELEKEIADKLIADGNAILPPKGSVVVDDNTKQQIVDLTKEKDELAKANDELTDTNGELAKANDELTATNGELAKANDELTVANGELAKANKNQAKA